VKIGKTYNGREVVNTMGEWQLWYEYPIPADLQRQKEAIRKLKTWIQYLEKEGKILGYAFDHYFHIPSDPNEPDELRIRFEYKDEEMRKDTEMQLEQEAKKLLPEYVNNERVWDSPEHILQAYELGSRCAFLTWELVESRRFPEEYFSSFYVGENDQRTVIRPVPFDFQMHFNHGVMNSLGIWKSPNEALIHLHLLKDCTKSRNKQELMKWIEKAPMAE
jgi:hypothetical protein